MADTSSPNLIKDPTSGAFYIQSQSGLTLETDSNILEGAQQGTIPYTTEPATGTLNPPGGSQYQSQSQTTDPSTGIDSSDPYTRFNMAIMDMLRTAQQGGQNTNLIAQQTALGQMQSNAMMAPGNPNLTNAQREQLRTASANMYQPEQDVVSNAIKAQDARLTTFENMWSEAQKAGTDIATMNPSPSIIESYVTGLTNGTMNITAIPDTGDLRAKVIKSMDSQQLQQWQDAQKPQIIKTTDANGNPITYAYNASTQTAIPLTNYGAQPEAPKAPSPKSNIPKDFFTKSQSDKLISSQQFTQAQIDAIGGYLSDGQDISTITDLTPAQKQELTTVMGTKPPAAPKGFLATAESDVGGFLSSLWGGITGNQ